MEERDDLRRLRLSSWSIPIGIFKNPVARLPLTCIVCTTRRLCQISAGSTISPRNATTRFNLFNLKTHVKTCISLNNVTEVRGVSEFDLRVWLYTWI